MEVKVVHNEETVQGGKPSTLRLVLGELLQGYDACEEVESGIVGCYNLTRRVRYCLRQAAQSCNSARVGVFKNRLHLGGECRGPLGVFSCSEEMDRVFNLRQGAQTF